jgi:hypothetical protein
MSDGIQKICKQLIRPIPYQKIYIYCLLIRRYIPVNNERIKMLTAIFMDMASAIPTRNPFRHLDIFFGCNTVLTKNIRASVNTGRTRLSGRICIPANTVNGSRSIRKIKMVARVLFENIFYARIQHKNRRTLKTIIIAILV